jgi:hypothetical protein
LSEKETLSIPAQVDPSVRVYEYGCKLDPECIDAVWEQISMARALYNNLVADMRRVMADLEKCVLEHADPQAQVLITEIEALSEQFNDAKAARDRDEDLLKRIAHERREKRIALSTMLKPVRNAHKSNYLGQIGQNSKCTTYILSRQAVDDGLGWATANAVLKSALQAFKARIKVWRAPDFVKGAEKTQDSLCLQFVERGGVKADTLFSSRGTTSLVLSATNGFGPHKRGEFRFRIGSHDVKSWATGICVFHREVPAGSSVANAAFVRRQIGSKMKYTLQLIVKLPQAAETVAEQPKSFATIHFGWAITESGRHVMAIADEADPDAARMILLPASIEDDHKKLDTRISKRDNLLNKVMHELKQLELNTENEEILAELAMLKRLQERYWSARPLYRLLSGLRRNDLPVPEFLQEWGHDDRILHLAIARLRARVLGRRKDFYRVLAHELAQTYRTLVIERLDLKKTNTRINTETGEVSKMNRKSRRGQRLVAIHEAIIAIRYAAARTGTIILELEGKPTVSTCAMCLQDGMIRDEEDTQILTCPHCGAVLNRKQNGAAVAWTLVKSQINDRTAAARLQAATDAEERKASAAEKRSKIAAARAANRHAREQEVA